MIAVPKVLSNEATADAQAMLFFSPFGHHRFDLQPTLMFPFHNLLKLPLF